MIEDISQILICSFVLIICFHSSKVPYFCLIIPLQEFVIDSDVVITRAVLRVDHSAIGVPFDGLFIHLLDTSIANTYLVTDSCVFLVEHPGCL